jgi:hypothetical protein
MDMPRIFLGSSTAQIPLVDAITAGISDIARVEPWTTVFNAGTTTIERLLELTHQVDFAAFVFAHDDWTSDTPTSAAPIASPRDNVVFEAGLFGGVLGMRRCFILHAKGAKLPTDLLGLTSIRYDDATADADAVIAKLRSAILARSAELGVGIEGAWWQFSLTARTADEPSALSLLHVTRDAAGALAVSGRSWRDDGTLSARYWSEATKERTTPSGVFYYFNGERPRDPNAPPIDGTGEILLESPDRATGYWVTHSDAVPGLNARTSGVYLRADQDDVSMIEGDTLDGRVALIAAQLKRWQALANS